jgi:predicted transcriptional regulator YheO
MSTASIHLFLSTAEAIASLLYPYAEVIVHDLTTRKILAIKNNFSKRCIGDDSLLEEEADFTGSQDVLGPYDKTNWDGGRLKSITSILRDPLGKAIGLMCINLDVSQFEVVSKLMEVFLGKNTLQTQPPVLFNDDWQEKINNYVHTYLKEHHCSLNHLSRDEKRKLILKLYEEGAFRGKNAASYIGKILNLSRATIYNYLSEIEQPLPKAQI